MSLSLKILILQILTIPFVIFLFKVIGERKIAGVVAGFLFLTLSVYYLYTLIKKSDFLKMFSFYGVLIHLGLAVLPLLILRLTHLDKDFDSLSFLGVQAPHFHMISEKIYLIMILCTFLDLMREKIFKRQLSRSPS